jgi:predicted aldo/keto reductase-like oxidoreductase
MTLIEIALTFCLEHPAVTAPIIGPRTMEHLEGQLGASEVALSEDVLDRIDEIVPPGTDLNPIDVGWTNPCSPTPGTGAEAAAGAERRLRASIGGSSRPRPA